MSRRGMIGAALAAISLAWPLALRAQEDAPPPREERNRWRISVGATVIGPVRPRIGVSSSALAVQSAFGRKLGRLGGEAGGRTREEALAMGLGTADPNGVRRFDGGAWYDPVDAGAANDPEWSWNWRLHDPEDNDPAGLQGFVERTAYVEAGETVTTHLAEDEAHGQGDSSAWLPGLRVEGAYELYVHEGERPWGVDLAAAFAYYFERGLWSARGTAATAEVDGLQETGYYEWWNDSGDTAQYILDYERETQFHDGMWGAGTFGGPGAELASSAWNYREVLTESLPWSSTHALRYRAKGDYREYAFELMARPWWEPWQWLRLFGTVGAELSRREFTWSLKARGTDATAYAERGKERDWQLGGLLGGGLSVRWHDFVLAGEALWRFCGKDLEVSGRTVNGRVQPGEWAARLSLGYEF